MRVSALRLTSESSMFSLISAEGVQCELRWLGQEGPAHGQGA